MLTKSDAVPFPTRGTPGGHRDAWDEPDPVQELRRITVDTDRELAEAIASVRVDPELHRERCDVQGRRAGAH